MPKATSKTFKKKKYNARFPPARIKKIMQTDEEVGKVAAAVPVIISRALEMFIESLIMKTAKTTQAKNAKTLSTSHIKQTIYLEKQFDFLLDLVKDVPDHQAEDNNGDAPHDPEAFVKKGRGRPRKSTDSLKPGRKSKSNTAKTSSDTSDEEEDDEQYEDEDTETDEDAPQEAPILTPSTFSDRLLPVPPNMAMANNGSFPGLRGYLQQPCFSGAAAMSYSPSQSRSFVIQCPPYLQNIQNPVSAPPPISHPLPHPHLMPQNVITPQENTPINLSNPIHRPAVGTNEDDDYDS